MYFCEGRIFKIAPVTKVSLLENESKSSPKRKLLDMFTSMMNGYHLRPEEVDFQPGNFLERIVQESAQSESIFTEVKEAKSLMSTGISEYPYLPWLSKLFVKDLEFLSRYQVYFNAFLEDFLRLYGYIYTAQLTLNISNIESEPSAKPQYFIMENEKASKERVEIVEHGYKRIVENMHLLFPYLSISESLQDPKSTNDGRLRPLWWLAQRLVESDTPALKTYAIDFINDRSEGEVPVLDDSELSPNYWLKELLKASVSQFSKGKTRAAAQEKFIRTVRSELCSHFVRQRGDRGNVLVMNQDYVTLITNMVIGEEDTLRFSELIAGFKERGIFFDKQSQKALVEFYERMGNVERMSDSGDAVYVRKTI
ncbi:DNA phosphorothioation-dependent restriction protein DptG [Reinekea marina]|nr:DNA phosphorothioation-dependent restriction protein DptG [Reinekea marina]MDN3647576.1 DNA phosphorothioation-dependent restriction protein DptG [Reinekea marina]